MNQKDMQRNDAIKKCFGAQELVTHDAKCASMSKTGCCPRSKTYEAALRLKTGSCPRAETYKAAFTLKTGCCPRAETQEAICAFMLKAGCTLVASTVLKYIKTTKK